MLFSFGVLSCPIYFLLSVAFFVTTTVTFIVPDNTISKAGDDPSYTDKATFQRVMLTIHNEWRREHGAEEVSWDTKLEESAERLTEQCEFTHSNGPCGENLSAGYSTAQLSADTWGEERKLYKSLRDYERATPPLNTGHFTQMVWAATDRIGCSRMKCVGIISEGFESWFVVCEYAARGNMQGEYTKNVFKPVRSH